jgi:hypothetical protein
MISENMASQFRQSVGAFGEGATQKDYLNAECQLVNNKGACEQVIAMASK